MPDFQQFADKMRDCEFPPGSMQDFGPLDAVIAERHTRLLQQIWEWANSKDEGTFTRAYVRSLLVSQTDK